MAKKAKKILTYPKNKKYAGTHLIAEFWGGKTIDSTKEIKNILYEATKKSNNTALGIKIHKFRPQGVTGFILLAESHISIHTWPELNYVAIDIFSCGRKSRPYRGLAYLRKAFQPRRVKIKEVKRGK